MVTLKAIVRRLALVSSKIEMIYMYAGFREARSLHVQFSSANSNCRATEIATSRLRTQLRLFWELVYFGVYNLTFVFAKTEVKMAN